MQAVIHCFEEGGWAWLDYNGRLFPVPRELLPYDAREGDALRIEMTLVEPPSNVVPLRRDKKQRSGFSDDGRRNDD